jgi:hypothetical protein
MAVNRGVVDTQAASASNKTAIIAANFGIDTGYL